MYVFYHVALVPTNRCTRHVLDTLCRPALISRAWMRSSVVISALLSALYRVSYSRITRASSCGIVILLWSGCRAFCCWLCWRSVFNSRRGWRSWVDCNAILRTVFSCFCSLLLYILASSLSDGHFAWTVWKTIFLCFFIRILTYNFASACRLSSASKRDVPLCLFEFRVLLCASVSSGVTVLQS
jgi:hypothetical protein